MVAKTHIVALLVMPLSDVWLSWRSKQCISPKCW